MVSNDSVTYRFRIDLSQMTVEGQKAVALLEKLERGGQKAAKGIDKVTDASKRTKDQLAASAINFQTATQGMLNLSTAAVQTYTSISNLARANNRAKMSVIAVARAEDLLANKIERQNALREAGQAGSQKYINITKEIATAQADLTVKQEKMVIEQEAVNDIYMLFATNVANVTVSSMQTIAVLDKNQIILTKAKNAGQRISNFLSLDAARKAYSQAAAEGVNSASKGVAIGVTAKLTAAMWGLAAATKAVVASNPLLMAAMAAMTVAWAVHETDILGTKTALDEYLGVEEDHLKLMEQERNAANALTTANNDLKDSYAKLTPQVKQYLEMHRDAFIHMGDARMAAKYQAQLLGKRPQDFNLPSVGGGFTPTTAGVAASTATATATAQADIGGGLLPAAYGDSASPAQAAATPAPPVDDERADPFGTPLQKELYKMLNPIEQRDTAIVLAAREQAAGRIGKSQDYLNEARKLLNAAKNYVDKPQLSPAEQWEQRMKGISSDALAASSFKSFAPTTRTVGAAAQELRFGIDIASRRGIDPKSTRGQVLNKTGRDIGLIGNLVSVNEGIRLANLQTTMAGFSNTKGGKASLAIAAVGGNATQAWQIPEFGIRPERRRQLDIRDRNTNLLRFGGKLRPGFSIWDEDAVIGGYGSRKAYSDASKRIFYNAVDEANRMMTFFGGGIDSSRIRGRSSLRSEQTRVKNRAFVIREALTLAGLGYRTINTRIGRRPDRWRVLKLQRDLAETISYNNNQYAKAQQINLLEQDYQLRGFVGTDMSLPSLQDRVAAEDERMRSIGLNRTEAFQIIDTAGRGREEIDDRILWKDRLNHMSTGTSVL